LETLIDLVLENYQWLFSGLGVAALGLFVGRSARVRRANKQTQNVGDHSKAQQAGRDISSRD
jgi:hypothetical protein